MEIFLRNFWRSSLNFPSSRFAFKGIVRIFKLSPGAPCDSGTIHFYFIGSEMFIDWHVRFKCYCFSKIPNFFMIFYPHSSHSVARTTHMWTIGGERRRWTQRHSKKVLSLTKSMTAKSRKKNQEKALNRLRKTIKINVQAITEIMSIREHKKS